MAVRRINIDLAIPEAVFQDIPAAKKQAFVDAVHSMKALAVKVNEGAGNEEMTVKATIHTCYHDENTNKPCEPEQEI